MDSIILNTHEDQGLQSANVLKSLYRKPKKYQLSKLMTEHEKNFQIQAIENCLKNKKKRQQSDYFTNILRIQKQNLFKNTFLRKLKSSIVMNSPPDHGILTDQYFEIEEDQQGLQVSKSLQAIIVIFTILQSTFLLILVSFSIIFHQVAHECFTFYYTIFSLIVHLGIIVKKFITHTTFQETKLTKCKQIISNYLQNQFTTDLIILCSFIITLATNFSGTISVLSRFLLFLKLKQILFAINYFEISLIKNLYKQQIWSLIKVFISNFMFAHIIAIILISMTKLTKQNNWLVTKNLTHAHWSEIYIWAYYWATTVMLTVGFGDITPTTTPEASCMIFVQMMSCVILAYNFNCVGTILTKIRSYEVQKKSNLKTFNYMKENSQMSLQTTGKIMNYIKQSTEMKRNFNIQQQKEFLQKLPSSFKNDLLKQKNRGIWNNMMFFRNLSQKTLLNLSIIIQKKLAHPDEIVYKRDTEIDLIIFNKGGFGYSYNNGNSPKNGTIIQQFKVQGTSYKIISLDFLIGKTLNYDVCCTEYSMVYRISKQKLMQVLKQSNYDFEYYSMIKDKDKYLLNEFQIQPCQICHKQRHSLFKCTKLHYLPLAQHVLSKRKDIYYKNKFQITRSHIETIKRFKTLKYMKNLKKFALFSRYKDGSSKCLLTEVNLELENSGFECEIDSIKRTDSLQSKRFQENRLTTKYYEQAVNQIKTKLDNLMSPAKFSWEIDLDVSHNYKFYFRKDNADQITAQMAKKLGKAKKKNEYPFKCIKNKK